jgi:hypothetical protein
VAADVDAAGINAAEINTVGINAAEINTVGVNTSGVNTSGVNTSGVNTSGVNAAGTNAAGINAAGINAAGIDTTGIGTVGVGVAGVDEAAVDGVMRALVRERELLPTLAGLDSVGDLTDLVRAWQRRRGLAELKRAVRDPAIEPAELRELLRREHWIFGGQLVPWPAAHPLPGETIPLLQFDGALHLISVERPRVADLVSVAGTQYSLSPLVAAAGDRARAMIRLLDSERPAIEDRVGLAYGRALVTIVIGHPDFVAELDGGRIREEIRAFNTLSAGITVMTYEDLVTIAERTSNPLPD